MWEHRIEGKDSGYWPTPTVHGNNNRHGITKKAGDGLATAVKKCKTPSAADAYTGNMKKDEFRFGNSGSLAQEVESGFLETHRMWPTPNTMDSMKGRTPEELKKQATYNKGKWGPKLQTGNLRDAVMWPTPEANERNAYPRMTKTRKGVQKVEPNLAGAVKTERNSDGSPTGGQLNPNWVEWLIGWPIGWTDLKPLAMGKYQQWLRQHGLS
jgi:hypothetical protein